MKSTVRFSGRDKRILIYLGFFVALIPVMLLRDFTPSNELRYLSIADEALKNHTFFAFTNHGIPYADKPPLYLWLIMGCCWLAGGHYMWLISIFSVLPAIGTAWIMDSWIARSQNESVRETSLLTLLTSGLFVGSALTLRMDMLMCFFIILAMREFWLGMNSRSGDRRSGVWLFPIFLFLALFTKGPYGLLIPLASTTVYLALNRSIRMFFRFWGWRTWSVLIVLCAAWFGAVYAEGGSAYLDNLLFHQTIDRAVNSFHHDAPFYYYGISLWYSLAPWSLVTVTVFVVSLFAKDRRSELEKFFQTAGVTTFILLSCFSAKLQIYLLPAFPFIVYGALLYLHRYEGSRWLRVLACITAAIFIIMLPAVFIASGNDKLGYLRNPLIYIGTGVMTASGILGMAVLWRKGRDRVAAMLRIMAAGMLTGIFVAGWALPAFNGELGYAEICGEARKLSEESGITDIRTWKVHRAENMDVYLGHPVTVLDNDSTPAAGTNPYILITRSRYLPDYAGCISRDTGGYAVIVVK